MRIHPILTLMAVKIKLSLTGVKARVKITAYEVL